jgi:5-methylcytosine-specific restriction endonuclease McrA
MPRPFSYSTTAWRNLRLWVLDRDLWTCQMCGVVLTQGRRDSRSAVVDHIEPVALSPGRAWDRDNLRAVCKRCHAVCDSIEKRSTDAEAIRDAKLAYRPVGLDGYPVAPA